MEEQGLIATATSEELLDTNAITSAPAEQTAAAVEDSTSIPQEQEIIEVAESVEPAVADSVDTQPTTAGESVDAQPTATGDSVDAQSTEIGDSADTQSATTDDSADTQSATLNEYVGKSKGELIELLAEAIAEKPIQQLRLTIEAVKIAFYKLHRAEGEAQKEAFVAAGGDAEAFQAAADANELKFKELLTEYRTKRDAYMANLEQDKESNLNLKLTLIEELKELSNSSETMHNTFAAFRELQNRWKEIGLVPQDKIKDLWDTYHHHVENFYNFIKINKELRDIDLKRNYEAKIALCEEAEALMLNPSATAAFHRLQKLHDEWREVGPVSLEFKEQIWERFKEASTRVNKRHQEYYDIIKDEQVRNLQLKAELCSKVEELAGQPFTTRKEWSAAAEQIGELQKVWKTIGFAPKKDNTAIYDRFRKACDTFFEAKRTYFDGLKSEMDDNLQIKIDLCIQAEAVVDSEDWKKATDAIIDLQKKWKESGAVARKHADEVWKRFRTACDKFFERKSEHFSGIDNKFAENLEAKKQILIQLQQLLSTKEALTFDTLKEYQRRWSEIGFVPIKAKDAISKQYKEVVDALFVMLRSGEGERRIERFREKVSSIKEAGRGRINSEREKLSSRIKAIESDIHIWQNNIGFFAKSKNADALVKDVESKIQKAQADIAEIAEKIKLIDNN